jgi:hypothetical protein
MGPFCPAGGTIFGGRREPVLAWHKAFYTVFMRYL